MPSNMTHPRLHTSRSTEGHPETYSRQAGFAFTSLMFPKGLFPGNTAPATLVKRFSVAFRSEAEKSRQLRRPGHVEKNACFAQLGMGCVCNAGRSKLCKRASKKRAQKRCARSLSGCDGFLASCLRPSCPQSCNRLRGSSKDQSSRLPAMPGRDQSEGCAPRPGRCLKKNDLLPSLPLRACGPSDTLAKTTGTDARHHRVTQPRQLLVFGADRPTALERAHDATEPAAQCGRAACGCSQERDD